MSTFRRVARFPLSRVALCFVRVALTRDEQRWDSSNGVSHSIAKEAHEVSIALLAYIDAPVTPERTCDHRLTAAELAVDSRSARASLLTPSPFHPFSPSLSPSYRRWRRAHPYAQGRV